jgi:hypothetical protein
MPSRVNMIRAIVILTVFSGSCSSYSGRSFVPHIKGYPEKAQSVYVLNDELLEISGLVHLDNERFAAINDEEGKLFYFDPNSLEIESVKFKGKGDYEDIVRVDSTFYVLESNGDLVEVTTPSIQTKTYKFHEKKIEFESLVLYKKENKVVLITKDQRKKNQGISAYSFDLATKQFDPEPFFTISFKEIFIKLENYNAEAKPSAAAINPINNKLYILSSLGRVLMECTREGKLERIYKINPTHFPQAEGITFATNGNMYISNEGADGKATILKFPYSAPK